MRRFLQQPALRLLRRSKRHCLPWLGILFATQLASAATAAREASTPAPAATVQQFAIVLARERRELPPPLSLLDTPAKDDAIAGAQLAINDNNTTGRFLNQEFHLEIVQGMAGDELIAEVDARVRNGASFIVLDATPQTVVALADRAQRSQRADPECGRQ